MLTCNNMPEVILVRGRYVAFACMSTVYMFYYNNQMHMIISRKNTVSVFFLYIQGQTFNSLYLKRKKMTNDKVEQSCQALAKRLSNLWMM